MSEQSPVAESRPADEPANLISHAAGFLLSLVATVILIRRILPTANSRELASCLIYGASMMGLYAASTLSHAFRRLETRRFFRTLDQACIYLFIAGTYTPVVAKLLWYSGWPILLIVMWLFAICGVVLVLRMGSLSRAAKVTYGVLGWLPILSLPTLLRTAPPGVFGLLLGGGLCYSFGALFLRFGRQVRYFHALWHIAVIAGSACHFFAILRIYD